MHTRTHIKPHWHARTHTHSTTPHAHTHMHQTTLACTHTHPTTPHAHTHMHQTTLACTHLHPTKPHAHTRTRTKPHWHARTHTQPHPTHTRTHVHKHATAYPTPLFCVKLSHRWVPLTKPPVPLENPHCGSPRGKWSASSVGTGDREGTVDHLDPLPCTRALCTARATCCSCQWSDGTLQSGGLHPCVCVVTVCAYLCVCVCVCVCVCAEPFLAGAFALVKLLCESLRTLPFHARPSARHKQRAVFCCLWNDTIGWAVISSVLNTRLPLALVLAPRCKLTNTYNSYKCTRMCMHMHTRSTQTHPLWTSVQW